MFTEELELRADGEHCDGPASATMNILDYRPQSMPSPTWTSDHLKNDFQNAIRRNLHSWVAWRTRLNDTLVDAVMTGSHIGDVEPLGQYLNRDSPHPTHPTTNPKTLLTFSASNNSSTNLHTKDFYKYGIPRVKVDPRMQMTTAGVKAEAKDGGREKTSSRLLMPPPAMTNIDMTADDQDDDELVLDYFNYDTKPSSTRRFHRSAATLPVAPSDSTVAVDKQEDRRTQMSKKSEQRRLPPGYVEPFIGPKMITARRDDVLYTKSAWLLDEL